MSRIIATQEAVWNAAEAYVLEGYSPRTITFAMIREKLGGGSNTTIQPHLTKWIEQRLSQAALDHPMPKDMADYFTNMESTVWRMALTVANEKLQHKLEEFDHQVEEKRRLIDIVQRQDEQIANLEKGIEDNQRRFVAIIDSLNKTFNFRCGGFHQDLKTTAPTLADDFLALKEEINQLLEAAEVDHRDMLNRYLHAAHVGEPADTEAPTQDDDPRSVANIVAQQNAAFAS